MATSDITAERLRECLFYEAETGKFTWIKPTSNRIKIGYSPAYVLSNGYMAIRIDGRLYTSHRLAWLYCNGSFPAGDIDHINGIRTDNRICNLRSVSRTVNLQNIRHAKITSKLGLLGVSRDKKRFVSRINVNGERVNLGQFDSPQAAHEAYLSAKRKLHEGNTI